MFTASVKPVWFRSNKTLLWWNIKAVWSSLFKLSVHLAQEPYPVAKKALWHVFDFFLQICISHVVWKTVTDLVRQVPKNFSISCSFSENLANSYVGICWRPSWIRPWVGKLLFPPLWKLFTYLSLSYKRVLLSRILLPWSRLPGCCTEFPRSGSSCRDFHCLRNYPRARASFYYKVNGYS